MGDFKKFIVAFIALLWLISVGAEIVGTPFQPETDVRLDRIESAEGDVTFTLVNKHSLTSSIRAADTDGLNFSRYAKATFVLDGLGISSVSPEVTTTIPAKSVLIGGFLYNAVTLITSGLDPLLKYQCEDDANIAAAALPTLTAAAISGISAGRQFSLGGAAPVAGIASDCNILATISHGTFSQGTVNLFLEYTVTD